MFYLREKDSGLNVGVFRYWRDAVSGREIYLQRKGRHARIVYVCENGD
jgi:hypothetical protein